MQGEVPCPAIQGQCSVPSYSNVWTSVSIPRSVVIFVSVRLAGRRSRSSRGTSSKSEERTHHVSNGRSSFLVKTDSGPWSIRTNPGSAAHKRKNEDSFVSSKGRSADGLLVNFAGIWHGFFEAIWHSACNHI